MHAFNLISHLAVMFVETLVATLHHCSCFQAHITSMMQPHRHCLPTGKDTVQTMTSSVASFPPNTHETPFSVCLCANVTHPTTGCNSFSQSQSLPH